MSFLNDVNASPSARVGVYDTYTCKVHLFVNQVERITTLILPSIEASLEGMVEYNTVLIDLENFGFNQKNVIDVIQELLKKGVLFEPKSGKLVKVG